MPLRPRPIDFLSCCYRPLQSGKPRKIVPRNVLFTVFCGTSGPVNARLHHVDFFRRNNDKFVATFDKGHLPTPPARKLLIVTCMDARIDPVASLGLEIGDAQIIRNAGGRVQDAIRSIIISQRLLGTREIAVFHHTDCGLQRFSTPELRDTVKKHASLDVKVAEAVDQIDFLEFEDLEASVKQDVQILQKHPLVLEETVVSGWIYDVRSGKATKVA